MKSAALGTSNLPIQQNKEKYLMSGAEILFKGLGTQSSINHSIQWFLVH